MYRKGAFSKINENVFTPLSYAYLVSEIRRKRIAAMTAATYFIITDHVVMRMVMLTQEIYVFVVWAVKLKHIFS